MVAVANPAVPLAVDLDGTLIRSDTLHEGLFAVATRGPRPLAAVGRALFSGRAGFKRAVAGAAPFDPALLPYDPAVLAYLRAQRAAGRRLGLFTAADQSIADAVAGHLGLFEVARGSDGLENLSGEAKAAAIAGALGPEFAYAGNGAADLPIFRRARQSVLVGPVAALQAGLPPGTVIEATFPVARPTPRTWLRALRVRHWAKNLLVFVAPLLSAQWWTVLGPAALLFLLLGLLASATYLVNDMLDLVADRRHPAKRDRPLASGLVTARDASVVAAGLAGVALGVSAVLLPGTVTFALVLYLVVTLLYSAALKRVAMVDITVLAGLFTLRILAGNALLVVMPISPWLLTFSMLFFLGLAATKRYAELRRLEAGDVAPARGYSTLDLPILLTTGVASGLSAIVIFVVYLVADQYPRGIYTTPGYLWTIMPILLIWTLRLWHLCVHGRLSEDPVEFALRDRFSLALGVAVLLVIVAARL